jgi:hypothetical protein
MHLLLAILATSILHTLQNFTVATGLQTFITDPGPLDRMPQPLQFQSYLLPAQDVVIEGKFQTAAFQVELNSKLIVRINMDGSIEFGQGISPSEAASVFYREYAALIKSACKEAK